MKILLEDMKTEIKETECDLAKGRVLCKGFDNNADPILVYVLYTESELLENERQEVEDWFNTEYREQFEKCTRRSYLGIKMSDGSDPKEALDKLYLQAEEKASRIREIKDTIKKEK